MVRDFIEFLYCTGARYSEAVNLKREKTDLVKGEATFLDTKNGEDEKNGDCFKRGVVHLNSNVLGYTIMYHVEIRLSSKKANFFYLFLSIAVLAVSPIIHKGKITRRKRARMKSM